MFPRTTRRALSGAHKMCQRRLLRFETVESRRLLAGDMGTLDDLAALSDEFSDSANISSWQRVNEVENWNADQLQVWDIHRTQPSRMVMVPYTVVWYQDWRGPMAFKDVTGDFVITSEVHITDRDDVGDNDADDVPDDAQFSLGGVMIRTPRRIQNPLTDWTAGSSADDGTNNGENYVFLSMGHGTDGNFSFEVKTTRNSNSRLELTSMNSNTATLQIARIGDSIITLYQLPGEDWVVHRRYRRADMPATLQVGIVSYSDWEKASDFDPFYHNGHVIQPGIDDPTPNEPFNPDLVASYEYARYARPVVPSELRGVDLVSRATSDQLLSFLGEHAVSLPGGRGHADDINALFAAIRSGSSATEFDLDGSGSVDQGDVEFLVENTLCTFMGDATLDGRVNATDLNQLGIHWQLASRAGWQDGDFNGDGNVNAADLNILGLNWQRVAAVTEPEAGSHLRVPRAPLPAGAMSPIRAMNVEFWGVATTVPQPIGQDAGLSPHETFFSVQHQQIHLPSKRHSTRIARYGHGQNHLMHVEHTIAEQDVIDKLFSWQFGEAFCDCFPKTSGPSSNQ